MDVRNVFKAYVMQLSEGCDRIQCSHPYCKRSKSFMLEVPDQAAVLKHAKDLLSKHGKSELCPGLCDSIFNPAIERDALEFGDALREWNASDKTGDLPPIIGKCLGDRTLFTEILKKGKVTEDDLALDNALLSDLISFGRNAHDQLEVLDRDFNKMISGITLQKEETLHDLRGLIMGFCLDLFLSRHRYFPVIDLLGDYLQNESMAKIFLRELSRLPAVLDRAIDVAHAHMSFVSLGNLLIKENAPEVSIVSLNWADQHVLRNSVMESAHVMDLLRQAAEHSDTRVLSERFTSSALCACLDPAYDVLTLLGRDNKYDILPYSVMDIGYKKGLVRLFRHNQIPLEHILMLSRGLDGDQGAAIMDLLRRELGARQRTEIDVRRDEIVNDAISTLGRLASQGNELLKPMFVTFRGEKGIDDGGLSREFFYLFCNEAFSPDYGMFRTVDNGKLWFVDRQSVESMISFKVLGTVLALAMYNNVVLPIRFPRALYRKMLGLNLTMLDLGEIDSALVASFTQLRELKSTGADIEDVGLTFSVDVDVLGVAKPIALKEGGEDIPVTNDTLEEYIALYRDYVLNVSVQDQFNRFLTGYNSVCPESLRKLFTYDELDLLISGIDVVDWSSIEKYAQYRGYDEESRAVKWFWEIFRDFSDEQKAKFLRFSTGSDRAPVGGLKNVPITLQRSGDAEKLPVAHTCFNIFQLPDYASRDVMRRNILIAIEHSEGFGLV